MRKGSWRTNREQRCKWLSRQGMQRGKVARCHLVGPENYALMRIYGTLDGWQARQRRWNRMEVCETRLGTRTRFFENLSHLWKVFPIYGKNRAILSVLYSHLHVGAFVWTKVRTTCHPPGNFPEKPIRIPHPPIDRTFPPPNYFLIFSQL